MAAANKAIRCLIILAHVVSADETPIRVGPGPKTRKRYLLVACTSLLTYSYLGGRSMATFAAFILPDMDGAVVVHDRYQNYTPSPAWSTSCAGSNYYVILRTPCSNTRTRTGRSRSPRPCKA